MSTNEDQTQAFHAQVAIVSLGCAKNLVDSEVMLGVLAEKGFRPVPNPEDAELVIVNTCGFLQNAVEEGIDRILEIVELKNTGRCKKLIVAGCMVERYRDSLAQELPEVDAFVSIDEIAAIGDKYSTSDSCFDNNRKPTYLYDHNTPRLLSTGGNLAYVKIAEGCNRPCSFCIIPKIRGSYRSRRLDSVLAETQGLIDSGVKEIDYIAQDVTFFGNDLKDSKESLVALIDSLSSLKIPEDFWFRILYTYPAGISEELVKRLGNTPHLCNYLDLPLQHISDKVLKNMRRPLGESKTRKLIADIKRWNPAVTLRTTFIVGFPGETEEDVQVLEGFIREGHFDHVGIFAYSQEEEAHAFNYPEQVITEEGERRRDRLMKVQQSIVAEKLSKRIDAVERVLVEGFHPDTDLLLVGRTVWQAPEVDGQVIINDLGSLTENPNAISSIIGTFQQVQFTEVSGYDLVGTIISNDNE